MSDGLTPWGWSASFSDYACRWGGPEVVAEFDQVDARIREMLKTERDAALRPRLRALFGDDLLEGG